MLPLGSRDNAGAQDRLKKPTILIQGFHQQLPEIFPDLYFNYFTSKCCELIKIAPDKWKHFFVGILMGATLQICMWYLMPQHYLTGILISFILVVAISYGFELLSLITKKGLYDILDAVAGITGGVIGMGMALLIELRFLME